jgi:general stress protein YciG
MPRNDEQKSTSNRGFASMDRTKQRQIASKGGQSVPPEKRSFSQDPQLAAQAGRKGGESVPAEGRSFSQNRELAAEAGRKGGQARGASSQRAAANRANAAAGMQDAGKTEAQKQGGTFKEDRDIAAEGARKAGLPKDQLAQDERSRFRTQGSNDNFDQAGDLEDRNDLRGSHDVEQNDLAASPRVSAQSGAKGHPHGV